ncbi:hypothetical protein FM038_004680 [Shewanella eurypsychrophilus]|uniref:Uncharacterized protein n=1 Tax=Shewanella eurypsychrophilus TaxID=2593656 RepID=A0ABX6V4T8_9GAMM|nr:MULTISPECIES: hypothetical protein [Shewanella]QFU21511.1 hypothetical protein FS418_06260 [Shewanella sp. YLB-09]QPG56801.1 hypothetical protein FM038_004680 [Shewanella eurypsychrophilus]
MAIFIKRVKNGLASLALLLFVLPSYVDAGQVVVRKSSEPFDAFAVRDQVLREHEWQEALRMQQQIQILQALPVGCILMARPYAYYSCQGSFYRPYQYKNKDVYIQVDAVGDQD